MTVWSATSVVALKRPPGSFTAPRVLVVVAYGWLGNRLSGFAGLQRSLRVLYIPFLRRDAV